LSQKMVGYCWPTPKCRNLCVPHAFLEGKKAGETSPRKSTPRTLKPGRLRARSFRPFLPAPLRTGLDTCRIIRLSSFLMLRIVSAVRISRPLTSCPWETCLTSPLGSFVSSVPVWTAVLGRIRARYLMARLPHPPVRPVRETFASYGSRERDVYRKRPLRQLHGTFTVVSLRIRWVPWYRFPPLSLRPFAMYVAFLRSDSYGLFDCLQGLGDCGTGLPCLLPTLLASPVRLSRVQHGGRKPDDGGGVFSLPHPLSAAPQARHRVHRGLWASFPMATGLSMCRTLLPTVAFQA
jgi:hypothetical protein